MDTSKLVVSCQEFVTMPRPEVKWVVEGLIPRPSLILMNAPPKAGKSFLALQVGMDLARGDKVLGFHNAKPRRVLYIQLDTSEMIWRDRILKLNKQGITLPDGLMFPNPEIFQLPCLITDKETRVRLRALLDAADPDVVVIDVYREIHQNNENDSTEIKIVNDRIQEVFGSYATLLIHHSKKAYFGGSGDDGPITHNPIAEGRGSSGIAGKADAIWSLRDSHMRIVPRFDEPCTIPLTRLKNGLWSVGEVVPTEETAVPDDSLRDVCQTLIVENPSMSPYKVYLQHRETLKLRGISQATFYRILQELKTGTSPAP